MNKIDTKNKSKEELSKTLKELSSKLLQLRFDLAEKKLKDVTQIDKTKKDIARILTALKTQNL